MIRRLTISIFLILAFWQILALSGCVNPLFMATPMEALEKGIELTRDGRLPRDLLSTLVRVLIGVGISVAIGIPFGIAIGSTGRAFKYFETIIDYFRSIPPVIVFPLMLLVFDVSEKARVAVIIFGCLTVMLLNASLGVRHCHPLRKQYARLIGARNAFLLFRIILPESLPQIFVGLRTSMSLGIIIAVVTEMLIGVEWGIGTRASNAQIADDTPTLYAAIVCIGLLGIVLNYGLEYIERKTCHWQSHAED